MKAGPVTLPVEKAKKKFVQKKFASVTPRYDFLNSLLSLYVDHYWRRKTAFLLKDLDGPVLDLCAGTLPLSREVAGQKDRTVIALDFCFDMLKYGKDNLNNSYRGQIFPVCGDGEHLPLPAGVFTGFTVAFGIRNLTDLPRGFNEVYRVLKPGGTAAILEFSRPASRFFAPLYRFYLHRILPSLAGIISGDREAYKYLAESIEGFYSQKEVCAMMKAAGFVDISYKPLTMGIVTLYTGHRS